MAGVVAPVVYPLHEWDPVVLTDTPSPLSLALTTPAAVARKAGAAAATPLELRLAFVLPAAVRGVSVPVLSLDLPLAQTVATVIHRELVFLTPSHSMPARMAGRGLFSTVAYGMTVWRKDGVWQQGYAPSPRRLAGADRIYPGGRLNSLTPEARDELIAAGYGDSITLQET